MKNGVTETATKANGLLERFQKGNVLLGLMTAAKPVALLEQLNSALQAKSANVSGMLEAVKISSEHIKTQRSDEAFHQIFTAAEEKCEEYDLDPLEIPRIRGFQRRYTGDAAQHQPASPEEYQRKQYYELIDTITTDLSNMYDSDKSGLAQYMKLDCLVLLPSVSLFVSLFAMNTYPYMRHIFNSHLKI